jgi:hypothetical protein
MANQTEDSIENERIATDLSSIKLLESLFNQTLSLV